LRTEQNPEEKKYCLVGVVQRIEVGRSRSLEEICYTWWPGQALFVCITCHIYCIISMEVNFKSIDLPFSDGNIDIRLYEGVKDIMQSKV